MRPQSLEVTVKRGIVGGLGLFGLGVLLLPWADVRDNPSRATWEVLVIHVTGPVVAVALLSLWPRWPRLKPDARVGMVFATAFGLPVLGLSLVGVGDLAGRALVALVVALSVSALWWVALGQRLDAAAAGRLPPRDL